MKTSQEIRECVRRAGEALSARPPAARPDAPARAVWTGGLAADLVSDRPAQLRTDMPAALGGEDLAPSPGWYFRAAVASCLLTTIALHAAARGIVLRRLEVEAHSASDPRGLLGCSEGVAAGPQAMDLQVWIEAEGADEPALQDLLAHADAHAPMSSAVRRAVPLRATLHAAEPA